jgi:replication-associated recombination protein RarA
MTQLAEQYRPRTWPEVIGQERIAEKLDTLRPRGLAGRGYWINGPSGMGKTTIARLIAAEVASDWATEERDAHDLTPRTIDELEARCSGRPLGGGGWCLIVNEAHGLSARSVRRLLTLFDHLPPWVTWIFTTTNEGQATFEDMDDGGPLLSRCTSLQLRKQGVAPLLARQAREIATAEHMDGKPEAAYLKLVQDERMNMRAVLQRIEAGDMAE